MARSAGRRRQALELAPNVVLQSIAESELVEAIEWYSARSLPAARRFASMVDATMAEIGSAPASSPSINASVRRAIVPGFPYTIYFVARADHVIIVGIVHSRRHPDRWLHRD